MGRELTAEAVAAEPLQTTLQPSPAWSSYRDPHHFELERRLVHRTGWHYVGARARLGTPGRVTTLTCAGMSVLIVADERGTMRAFPNVCRHRGAEFIGETSEPLTRLSCRYHGWSWNPDGSLRAAPSTDLCAGDPCWALDQLPLATWGAMVFLKPSHDGPEFETVMGPLITQIATRVDVDALVPVERCDYSVRSNWKVWIENFNECYHCPVAHPEFNRVVHTNRQYVVERLGTYVVGHRVPFRCDPERMFYYAYAWPFLALGVSPDRSGITIISVRPETAETMSMSRELYQLSGVEHRALLDDIEEDVIQQDIDLCEMVQRGLANDAYAAGAVLRSREQAVVVFHELLRAHMG